MPSLSPAWAAPLGSPQLAQLHMALGLEEAEDDGLGRRLQLRARDGQLLAARAFEPAGEARAVAVLAPATGVPQRFYAPFARWLSGRGYAVLSLDYRGLAESAAPNAQGAAGASMRDWMLLDLPAALQAAGERAQAGARRLPLLWIGHSLGGHALALQEGIARVDAAVCVGAQLPAFARWPAGLPRWGARFFFQAWLPLWVRLSGRLPGWALGGGLTLPGPAARDWSRWGQLPNYFASDPQLSLQASRFQGVAQLWCISDDWVFGPEPAVQALHDVFPAGRAELITVRPEQAGVQQLGHFGVFRRQVGERLWPLWLQRIEAAVPALRT